MIEKQKIKLVGKPRKAVSILSSGNIQKDLEKIAEIKQEREQGHLENLFQSDEYIKRGCAAWKGYKLDILIDDPHPYVRLCVADSYYGLDKLATDPNKCVTAEVQRMLDLAKLTLEEWIERYPQKCALPENKAKAPKVCPHCKMKTTLAGIKFCPFCGASIYEISKGKVSKRSKRANLVPLIDDSGEMVTLVQKDIVTDVLEDKE